MTDRQADQTPSTNVPVPPKTTEPRSVACATFGSPTVCRIFRATWRCVWACCVCWASRRRLVTCVSCDRCPRRAVRHDEKRRQQRRERHPQPTLTSTSLGLRSAFVLVAGFALSFLGIGWCYCGWASFSGVWFGPSS